MEIIAQNKKAWFDYEIIEEIEAGLILTGAEIKSIRAKRVQLKGSYIGNTGVKGGRMFVKNMHISEYSQSQDPQNPLREREILLHKKELRKLEDKVDTKGYALIPLKLYLKRGYAKLLIGVGIGKKQYDKRRDLKKKSVDMDLKRTLRKI